MMQELSELQEIVLYARFDQNDQRGDTKSAWSHVLAIKDVSYAMPENVQHQAQELLRVWQENSDNLQADEDASYQKVDQSIDEMKLEIVTTIQSLK